MRIYVKAQDMASEDFRGWFGDWTSEDAYSSRNKKPIPSMVVNEDQTPKVMYHGTLKDFDEFEVGKAGYNSNIFGSWETTRNAIFFTPDPDRANTFTSNGGETSGGNIRPVYLNVRSPLDFRNGVDDFILDEFEGVGINPRWLINFNWEHLDGDDGKLFVDAAKILGYDGVVFTDEDPETREYMETWAVFDSSQVRSIYKNLELK